MATINRVYVLAAFFLSAIAAIFNIVSLSTEHWIDGNGLWVNQSISNGLNSINYGLFQGNFKRIVASPLSYQITMTCNFKNNVCALLCGTDRATLLDDLFNNNVQADDSSVYETCATVFRTTSFHISFLNSVVRADTNSNVSHDSFINAGVWLSTVVFLILAALIGVFTSVLALFNTVTNPVQYFLSVKSLFYYNAAAFCCTLLYMILWGTMYNLKIFHNAAVFDTLVNNMDTDKRSFLGYSYWISFVPLAFYTGSIATLYYREYLNAKDPKQQMVSLDVESSDPNLYLY